MAIFTLLRSLSASFLPASAESAPSFSRSNSPIFAVRNQTVASGYRVLDRELPNGGWPSAVLTELLLDEPDIGELNLIKNALPQMISNGKTLVILASAERKLAAKLNDFGLDLSQIILIETEYPASHIATVERIMREPNFGALLCWLPEARDDQLQRLHAAVRKTKGWAFIFRPIAQQNRPTPAMLRILCRAAASTCISLKIIKRRGVVQGKALVLPRNLPTPSVNTCSKDSARLSTQQTAFQTTAYQTDVPYQIDRRSLVAAASSHRLSLRMHLASQRQM